MLGIQKVVRKVIGTANDRELKSIQPLVQKINSLEAGIKPLSNEQLKAKTAEFKERIQKGETLDQILPEAFAVVREAAWRTIGQRHYDVQLIGGITLHRGRIAEMRTGEGKTLVATLPAYLNALSGKGVHVITVNDYLARRDSEWMGQIHRFLGLDVGIIVHGLTDAQRKKNYAADITYGTNNEFGFDYLRDNMKFRLEDYVQRELNFCIVDEVDSILIDEARTPLIISGPSEDSTDLYYKIDSLIRKDGGLTPEEHYTVDEKSKTAALTEKGVEIMEKRLGLDNLYDPANIEVLHHVNQGLRAHVLFKRDVEYVVRDGQIIIVDEFTGRMMPGRRWSDGLHQAIEAKEGVTIESENQTLATITFQNYFRMYNKLSGMTGTADTEAAEFKQIYNLDVTVIPTHRPIARQDHADLIFKSFEAKMKAIAADIKEIHAKGQPVLVGTVSIEKSELLSQLLKREGIPHDVLNAKQHEREANVVAMAGRKGAVTIATNMAGRGTDIVLGGNHEELAKHEMGPPPLGGTGEEAEKELAEYQRKYQEAVQKWNERCKAEREEVREAGGLFILGTERHESRRIDNQLRGRAGRQGDPGASRFYLSLDDDLMRIFGGANIKRFMEDDVPIEHKWINRAIENAQKKVEGHNYDIRKHLLEYDNVMNEQRKVVYGWRREVLARENLRDMVFSMVDEVAETISQDFFPNGRLQRVNGQAILDEKELNDAIAVMFQVPAHVHEKDIDPLNDKGLHKLLLKLTQEAYSGKESAYGSENMRQIERIVLLTTIDGLWKDHLLAMDHLREGIGLQGYGQKDPLIEYKKQGFNFFQMMMHQITGDAIRKLFAVQLVQEEGAPAGQAALMMRRRAPQRMQTNLSADGELKPAHGFPGASPHPASAQPMPLGAGHPEMAGAAAGSAPGARPMSAGPMARPMPAAGGPMGGMGSMGASRPVVQPVGPKSTTVGRNDPCWCGSGKKFKKCHGA